MKRILLFSLLNACSFFVFGQNFVPVNIDPHYTQDGDLRVCPGTVWEAGTSMQSLVGTNQNTSPEPASPNGYFFLCLNDQLDIVHDGNFNLDPTADPDPSTAAGISYVPYTCSPSATGPDAQNVSDDPCVLSAGNMSAADFYLIDNVSIGGSGTFTNDGFIQTTFNGGAPMELYFAPITVDNHSEPSINQANVDDYCVNVTASDAFRVVYLNEITLSNFNTSVGGNSCTGSFEISGGLPQFDALNGGNSNYNVTVFKTGNPAITANIGAGPFTEGSTVTFTVPEPGSYDIIIEDGKSCGANQSMDMSACVSTVTAVLTPVSVSCNGLSNGGIQVGITGGSPVYAIDWQLQPGGAVQSGTLNTGNQFDITMLSSGNYGVTVTDGNGETSTGAVFVPQPGALGISLDDVAPLCNGGMDGSITSQLTLDGVIVPSPDPADYTFTWNMGAITETTATITGLTFGAYNVLVTDNNGCTATAATTLSQPAPITAPALSWTDASCIGISNGTATINASGGTGTLSYAWSGSSSTTNIATGLTIGLHTVTVTDDNNCPYIDVVTVNAATALSVNLTATDITCNGDNNGQVVAIESVVGIDNGGYTYNWLPNVGATATVNSLAPNTYTVTITDANGCTAVNSATVSEPTPLTAMVNATNESCNVGNDGEVTVLASGGSPMGGAAPYTYNWSNIETTETITGLSEGIYTVTVTDANSCTTVVPTVVTAPNGPTITGFTETISLLCFDSNNGEIVANAVQGDELINDFAWSNDPTITTATNSNLGAGTYIVTVTDLGGCIAVDSFTLTAPEPLAEASAAVTTRPLCVGGNDGTVTLDITGGTTPYNYLWAHGPQGPSFFTLTDLAAGDYTVTVVDGTGICSLGPITISIEDPLPITILIDPQSIVPVTCNGGINCDGSATISASGGMSTNYTYTWDNGETGSGLSMTAMQLCQGNHSVTVSDGICPGGYVFDMGIDTIPAPAPVGVASGGIETVPVTCFGDHDGSATITPTGGSGNYTIEWSDSQTDFIATGLSPTTYTITITDDENCASNPIEVYIGEPDLLELLVVDTIDVSCSEANDGWIQVAPVGGNPGFFTYEWSHDPTNTTNAAGPLPAGDYSITVTDETGVCTASTTATLTEPEPLYFEYVAPEEPQCNGYTTIFPALDSVSGGTGGPYLYTIDGFNFNSTDQPTSILAGTYTLEVIDASGTCTATEEVVIDEPLPITVDLGPDVEIQLGESYEITASVFPLGAVDSILWMPSTSLSCTDCLDPTATPLDDVTYTVLITDSNSCTGTGSVYIDVDPNRNVYIPNVFSPNGDGVNDIFIPYTGSGVSNIKNMIIFDRWGELVYSRQNFMPNDLATNGWDGYLGGKIMDPAVFVYIIEVEFMDGIDLRYKGDVTLVR